MAFTYSQAVPLKNALFAAAQQLFANQTPDVGVYYGARSNRFDIGQDYVEMAGFRSQQIPVTMSRALYTRDEAIQVDIEFGCTRGGGDEMEQVCTARAAELLGIFELYVRSTDPNLASITGVSGGFGPRPILLTDQQSTGQTDPENLSDGRWQAITATFSTTVRLSN